MINKAKKEIKRLILVLLAVTVVSLLIFVCETKVHNEGFSNIFNALWYMLVTISTVGYGDIYPQTILGKVLASILIILTPVTLTYIVKVVWDMLSGSIILRLYLSRKKHWYVFDELNNRSKKVIDSILSSENNDYIVVCRTFNKEMEYLINEYIDNKTVFCIDLEYDYYIKKECDVKIFLINNENDADILAKAKEIENKARKANKNINIYIASNMHFDIISNNIHVFNVNKTIAQSLINDLNKELKDEKIVLAGEGEVFEYLFESLIINNVYDRNQKNEYYIITNDETFKNRHYRILGFLEDANKESFKDKVYMFKNIFESKIMQEAHVVILCYDDDRNIEIANAIKKYYSNNIMIYIRYSNKVDNKGNQNNKDMIFFGSNEEVFTFDKIVNESLYKNAKELNNKYIESYGGKDWDKLDSFKKESNISSCNHFNVKRRIVDKMSSSSNNNYIDKYKNLSSDDKRKLFEIEHERWCRFHYIYNWEYSMSRNDSERKHNLLVPFSKLSDKDIERDRETYEFIGELI